MHVSPTMWLYYLRQYFRQRQVILLVRFFGVCVLFVAAYSVLFHVFMAREGHTYSWVTGLYWTLTVMSTLGFGDITFTSDVGRVFTLVERFVSLFQVKLLVAGKVEAHRAAVQMVWDAG